MLGRLLSKKKNFSKFGSASAVCSGSRGLERPPFPVIPGFLPLVATLSQSPVASLTEVSWQYERQGRTKAARGAQTERTAGAGGQMHLWSRVFLPEPALCAFFFLLDKSLLGNECTQTGLWLSRPPVFQGLLIVLGLGGDRPQPRLPPRWSSGLSVRFCLRSSLVRLLGTGGLLGITGPLFTEQLGCGG